jgi:hypothetical protein
MPGGDLMARPQPFHQSLCDSHIRDLAAAIDAAAGRDSVDNLPGWVAIEEVVRHGGPRRALQTIAGERRWISVLNQLTVRVKIDHFDWRQGWFVVAKHTQELHNQRRREADPKRYLRFNHIMANEGHTLLEAWDCSCGSTLCFPGIGPVTE